MKITLTREVELNETELALLNKLNEEVFLWNYATDGFELETLDSLCRKGLAKEDSDGRVSINAAGYMALILARKALTQAN